MGKFFGMLKAGTKDFLNDECMVSGAALAYYTVFSLPPLLVLVFFVAGMFGVSEEKITQVVRKQVGMPVPNQTQAGASGSETSEDQAGDSSADGESSADGDLGSVAQRQSSKEAPLKALGPVSRILGIALLIFSATGVFAQLQRALNRAWEVEPDPEQGGWKSFVAKRGLSLGMIVVIAFLLLVSLVLTTVVDEVVQWVVGDTAGRVAMTIGFIFNSTVALAMATVLFALMFKILPDADMRWKDMWMGALLTAILFVIGKTAIGWYLQNSNIGSAWGNAAASMIALLVWVYYTSLVVLYGAELTQAWAKRYGDGIVPSANAVRVVQEKRQVRGGEAARPA